MRGDVFWRLGKLVLQEKMCGFILYAKTSKDRSIFINVIFNN